MKKTVLITGSSRGIGRAGAELFAEKGYNVVINYLHSEPEALNLAASLEKKGHQVLTCKADVSQRDQVDNMIARSLKTFGTIDVLINNADRKSVV